MNANLRSTVVAAALVIAVLSATILPAGCAAAADRAASSPVMKPVTVAPPGAGKSEKSSEKGETARQPAELRPIRVAVFDFEVLDSMKAEEAVDDGKEGKEVRRLREVLEPQALTDQVNAMLAAMDKVTIVNRDQIKKVADEHKMPLAGLVDTASAAQLGKWLSAQYVIVGRASRIGQTNHLVLKIVDVATTVQTTVAVMAATEKGPGLLLERLAESLKPKVRELQMPLPAVEDVALAKLRKAAERLGGKVVLVDVSEAHVNRPLKDPAAQTAVANRLRSVGITVLVPKDPPRGWKEALLQTGMFSESKVDYLLEGEGTSAYATEIQGLISCRARVELRLIPVPGRSVSVSDKGVAARVDLVEALAAKAALEDAGVNAVDTVMLKLAEQARKDTDR